jgi:hypothetical protein
MSEEFDRQRLIDDEHLRLLSLGYIISAAMTAIGTLFALLYVFAGFVVMGVLSRHPNLAGSSGQMSPAFIGWIITGIGLGIFLVTLALAAAKFRAGICIKRRKSRTFCMVMAGISCLGVPYGTILGVMTFMVFGRPSVIRQFQSHAEPVSGD